MDAVSLYTKHIQLNLRAHSSSPKPVDLWILSVNPVCSHDKLIAVLHYHSATGLQS